MRLGLLPCPCPCLILLLVYVLCLVSLHEPEDTLADEKSLVKCLPGFLSSLPTAQGLN